MGLVMPAFGLFFWMMVSFGILFVILRKFAWRPILKALSDRENSIEEAMRMAEKARQEMIQLQVGNEQSQKEAMLERERIVKEAREMKDTIIRDARHEANLEANKVMENARAAMEQERMAAISEIKKLIADFSVDIAAKILQEKLSDDKQQKDLIQNYINQINLN